jgi:hypothetical protein
MKNLQNFFSKDAWWKYYPNGKVPGHTMKGSFWWRDILRLLHSFKGIAQVQLGTCDTILFWEDLWNGQILKFKYLELHSFAISKNITAQRVQ